MESEPTGVSTPACYRIFYFADSDIAQSTETAESIAAQSSEAAELYMAGSKNTLHELRKKTAPAGRFRPILLEAAACTKDGAFEFALRRFGDKDLIFVASGLLFPRFWDLRLAWTAQRLPAIATVSPICDQNPNTALECFGESDAGAEDPTVVSGLDWCCYQHSSLDLPDIGSFLQECVWVSRIAAKIALSAPRKAKIPFVQHFLRTTKELRFAHVLADHLYAGTLLKPKTRPPLPSPIAGDPADVAYSCLSALRHHARAYLKSDLSEVMDSRQIPTAPRQLHIAHSWGGGLERWVKEYCRTDTKHENLILKSVGTWGSFGMELHLFRNIQNSDPLRTWRISPPIRSTALEHSCYRSILTAIVNEFGIDAILVSSLIGHSLDALRQPARTVFVCHDYYPFCPALNITFDTLCESCDQSRLAACTKENPHNRFFVNIPPPHWDDTRKRFVRAVIENDVTLIAPVESVKTNYTRLLPALEGHFSVIPHGTKPISSGPVETAPPDPSRRLRVLMLGSLAPHKGLSLLREIKSELLSFADLHLVGCGTYGDEFQGAKGISIVSEYKRSELSTILHGIQPDLCLLLSVIPETFSYTLQETMELGIPPLATNIGSFADRIQDGVNGLLCEPRSEDILRRLRALRSNREILGRIAERLRGQKVRSIEEMLAHYNDLLQLPNSSAQAYFCDDSRLAKNGCALYCQLYWRGRGATFSEAQSTAVRFWKQPERQTIKLPIPAQAGPFAQLRLDPSNQPGGMIIHEMRLLDHNRRCLWMWTGSSRVLSSIHTHEVHIADPPANEAGALIQSCGADPSLILPCTESILEGLAYGGILEADLSCPLPGDFVTQLAAAYVEQSERLHTLECQPGTREFSPAPANGSVLRIESPFSQIQNLEDRVKDLESSLSWRITRPLRTALDIMRRFGSRDTGR